MGVESSSDEEAASDEEPGVDLEAVHDTLGTEDVTFVDDLNDEIAAVIESASALQYDYVLGDVSDYGISSNGHAHFDLVHEDATLHCVVFAYRLNSLGWDGGDGTQVAVKGELSYYADGGNVSIIVEDVVEIGDGLYRQTYEQNKRLLEADGLLGAETKQRLPALPRRIGIVTSASSDAREDAVTSIHDRHPGVDIVVSDTTVQGADAMASIMQAVSELDDDAGVDVIVLTRGGGADKHLRVFNETPLCRVLHNTSTPVVVGVGHETDRTLADEVADRRVMTPTHVGEIVPKRDDLLEDLATAGDRLRTAYTRIVTTRLDDLERDLDAGYEQHVTKELERLETDLTHAFESLATTRLTTLEERLDHALETLRQRKAHEQETAQTVESYERSRRRYVVVIAVMVLLVLLLLGYILFL